MRSRLEIRLQQLRSELENGQKMMADLENRRSQLQTTLLKIQGAIQVLEEELAADQGRAS
jgi:predicted  nucleic acid-binding Zn-ribbon protein